MNTHPPLHSDCGRQRGVVTVATLVIATATLTITAALLTVTTSQLRQTQKQDDRLRAVLLAESGIDLALTHLKTDAAYEGTGASPVALYKTPGAVASSLGAVSVSVTSAGTNLYRINATGTNPNGTSASVLAIIEGAKASIGDVSLSRYALLAKGNISIGGTPDIKTLPLNQHNADTHSNGNVSMNGNPSTDGSVTTVGTQSYAGIPSTYGARTTGAAAIQFPTDSTLNTWESDWKSAAQAGATYNAASLLPGSNSKAKISTPCYIDGDLSMGSQQRLTITGTGTCYINGSVSITGQGALINSALLVIKNGLTQTGNGYSANPLAGKKMATVVCLNNGFELRGTGANAGIVYAARGPVTVAGNTTFTGALVSGVGIDAQGNYTQYFPSGMASHIAFEQSALPATVLRVVEP